MGCSEFVSWKSRCALLQGTTTATGATSLVLAHFQLLILAIFYMWPGQQRDRQGEIQVPCSACTIWVVIEHKFTFVVVCATVYSHTST